MGRAAGPDRSRVEVVSVLDLVVKPGRIGTAIRVRMVVAMSVTALEATDRVMRVSALFSLIVFGPKP